MKKKIAACLLGAALFMGACGGKTEAQPSDASADAKTAVTETEEAVVAEPETELLEAELDTEEVEVIAETGTESEPETETETETETEVTTEAETEAIPDEGVGGGRDAAGNVTSIHLENEQIDLSTLSSALVEWGSGGPKDSLNRPDGCILDQNKYGHLNSYFIAPLEDETEKVVYLTFDIGYTNEATVKILDVLAEKGVKGLFFATKGVIENDDEVISRIVNEGHELGNHSSTHTNMQAKSVDEQKEEIMSTHQAALDKYGYEMHLWRFPEGKFSEQALGVVNNCNYKSVFWSFAYRDWILDEQPDVAETAQKCIDALHPGAIYLLHGISPTNAGLLGDLIDAGRAAGYRFELLQ